ncbi:hypothetical protein BOX15_Mlig025191g1 [Macrostomum lignano]|uniref:Dystrophin n=3 Tax=Macrostomum lignano TaxID=282301 RepID=A0A267FQP3_9PLAT|nr:hypothetical protein BOX15_Mlig025191g1 [Macrostomum lignano]
MLDISLCLHSLLISFETDLDAESLLHSAELEILSHRYANVSCGGTSSDPRARLRARLDNVNQRWRRLGEQAAELRSRIRRQEDTAWQGMLARLKSLNDWLASRDAGLRQRQLLLGGDSASLRQQISEHETLVGELQSRRIEVEQALEQGESYFGQQDFAGGQQQQQQQQQLPRPASAMSQSGHESGAESEDAGGEGEDQQQPQQKNLRLTRRIRRNLHQLKRRWLELNLRVREYQEKLQQVTRSLSAFEELLRQTSHRLLAAESELEALPQLDSLGVAQLSSELSRLEQFQESMAPLDQLVASLERQSQAFRDSKVVLTHTLVSQISDLRSRHRDLHEAMRARARLLASLRRPGGIMSASFTAGTSPSLQPQKSPARAIAPVSPLLQQRQYHHQQQQQQQQTQPHKQPSQAVPQLPSPLPGPSFAHPAVANSVQAPWQRLLHPSGNQVPYYRNSDTQETSWDHPVMTELTRSLAELNSIRYSAYRTAAKLKRLQRTLYLDLVSLTSAADVFRDHGIASALTGGPSGGGECLIDVGQMSNCLASLFARSRARIADASLQAQTIDLSLNWLLNVYDHVRSGRMRALSFKVGLVLLSAAGLEDKYRYLFASVADERGVLDQRRLGLLLHDCMQVPRHLGEAASFGGSNVEPSVRSCFEKVDSVGIRMSHFLAWLRLEPQSLVWLPVLHRLTCSEHSVHPIRCSSCKCLPMRGLRYKCLKCFNLNLCQECFFAGRTARHHKASHPMQEYVRAPGSGDSLRSLSRTLRNKFRFGGGGSSASAGSSGASSGPGSSPAKLGYLPVQTVREGQAIEATSGTAAQTAGRDVHSRVEAYATRLAEVEQQQQQQQQRRPPPPPSSASNDADDEHALIAAYAGTLRQRRSSAGGCSGYATAAAAATAAARQQMQLLEDENRRLQAEYEQLKNSTTSSSACIVSRAPPPPPPQLPPVSPAPLASAGDGGAAEARMLRAHKGRLEARMSLLEEHNRQLEGQLARLRRMLSASPGQSQQQQQPQHRPPSIPMLSPPPAAPRMPYQQHQSQHHRAGSFGCVSDSAEVLHQHHHQQQQMQQQHQQPLSTTRSGAVHLRHHSGHCIGGSVGSVGGSFHMMSSSGSLGRHSVDSCPTSVCGIGGSIGGGSRSSIGSLFAMAGQVSNAMGQLVDVMNSEEAAANDAAASSAAVATSAGETADGKATVQ